MYLIVGAIEAGNWIFVSVIVLSSMLALAYMMKVLRYIYLPSDRASIATDVERHDVPWTMLGPMLLITVSIVLLGIFNGDLVGHFIDPAVPAGLGRLAP